jgi:predicted RNA binding protein YcfA (HicA-like mRNA interferase family)
MLKLKTLSGKDVIKVLEKLGFSVVGQKGSHVKLKRMKGEDSQILTIPNHKELDKGTLKAIYNQSLRYLSDEEMRDYFYTE